MKVNEALRSIPKKQAIRARALAVLIIFSLHMNAFANESQNKTDPNKLLWDFFSDYDEYIFRSYPELATYHGDHRYDDKLTDNSEAAILARLDSVKSMIGRVKAIDYEGLTKENKLNYDLILKSLVTTSDLSRFRDHLMPVGQQSGIHISAPQIFNSQPLDNSKEFNRYFTRLREIGNYVDNEIDNMRKGMAEGIVMPAFIMEKTLPQLELIISKDPSGSVFMKAMDKGKDLTADERESITNELREIISHDLNPAFRRLHDFIKDEYIPACRKDAGIWSLPDGAERYSKLVEDFTTLDLTYEEIHETGLKEVERINSEMARVKDSIGFSGTLQEFNDHLRKDPSMYYTDKEDLMNGFRDILRKMEAKLPELFDRLPEAGYDLKEMEEFRAMSAPQAYYYPAPENRSRPGYFYVNTYDLPSRPKYTMTALALHEAVPGHHLQVSLAQELMDLPRFRRNAFYAAYMEGWALYAESLGYETGMYEDVYQHYGALLFEMWRACRLVVDTGIHGLKWTREDGYNFMRSYTANSDLDINSEIDRYIAWPGQALSYKIGELKIMEIRKKAEAKLGNKFDIKSFHNQLLKNGAVPLSMLERIMDNWITSQTPD